MVDDIAANRNLLGATLEPKGYEVLLAANGAAAVKVAARAQPDLILMDVNMPELDGYDACRQLKGMPGISEIPIIFITANDDPDSLVKAFQAGGVDYITKPFQGAGSAHARRNPSENPHPDSRPGRQEYGAAIRSAAAQRSRGKGDPG